VGESKALPDSLLLVEKDSESSASLQKIIPMYKYRLRYVAQPEPIPIPQDLGQADGFHVLSSTIVTGEAYQALLSLPSRTVRTVITSPPYWSLRDYSIPGQIGLENNPDDYLDALVRIFEEVRRVLLDDGSLWLNIGDSYTSGGRTWRAPDKK
jgi:hypothetical protein